MTYSKKSLKTPKPALGVEPCPCGRLSTRLQPLACADCCGQYLDGDLAAPDAESLMRSRYSAFVRDRRDYLLATWHESKRPAKLVLDGSAHWLGLEVRRHTVQDATHAQVEFVARYREGKGGPAVRLHETSRFTSENGRWYYLDGETK
jgi:SEC-C motif-containing protein